MARTYDEVKKQHDLLWSFGAASDMTGGYVDQNDLNKLLSNPSKKTAKHCMENQIRYWLQVGTEDGELVDRDRLIEENEDVRKIAIDYGFIDDED